jgi:hypothetical protein
VEYNKRLPNGEFVRAKTPGEDAKLSPELLAAFEAIAALDIQNMEFKLTIEQQRQEIAALRAEIESLKGGGQ